MKKYSLIAISFLLLSACANNSALKKDTIDETVAWDFDHNVQFAQKPLGNNKYYLEVRTNGKTKFSKLATFLLRKSYQLCHSYGFKIEVLEGIEEYEERVAFPHLLMGSLAANVECPSK
jgi:hypothetical protein